MSQRTRTSLRWRQKTTTNSSSTSNALDESKLQGNDKSVRRGICRLVRFMDGVAAVSVGAALLTWQLDASDILVQAASICTLFFGPYAAYQRRRIRKLGGSVRSEHNELRRRQYDLKVENTRLHCQAGRLQQLAQRARKAEYGLMRLGNHSKQQVTRLCHIVEEQRVVMDKIKQKLKAATIQNILSVVVKSDKNKDFSLSPTEVEKVIVRIGMMKGVHLNEPEFRRQIDMNSDRSLSAIMAMIRNLLENDDSPYDDEVVFQICPEELLTAKAISDKIER